jgi:hypothetical protein
VLLACTRNRLKACAAGLIAWSSLQAGLQAGTGTASGLCPRQQCPLNLVEDLRVMSNRACALRHVDLSRGDFNTETSQ